MTQQQQQYFDSKYCSDYIVFWPSWNTMQLGPLQADMDIQEHREQVSYGRVLMFFRSNVKLDNDETKEVELAYIEEYWQYKKNNRYSMVGSGNVQLYAPKVYYVIPIERILCKADIMRDPVTPTIPEAALPTSAAARARDYPYAHAGSELYAGNLCITWVHDRY